MLMGIHDFWSARFGLELFYLLSPGIIVINNEQTFLKGYHGAWIFNHRQSWIISVPPDLITLAQNAAGDIPTETLQSQTVIHQIFGARVERIVGPAYQGYADVHDVHDCNAHRVRTLTSADAASV